MKQGINIAYLCFLVPVVYPVCSEMARLGREPSLADPRRWSAWGRKPRPVDLPGRRRRYLPVGLDAASLPHTLPGKAPRPGLLVVQTPRSVSNPHYLTRTTPLEPSVKDREGGALSGPSPAGKLARSLHGCIHGVSRKSSPLPGPGTQLRVTGLRRLLGRDIGRSSRPKANQRREQ